MVNPKPEGHIYNHVSLESYSHEWSTWWKENRGTRTHTCVMGLSAAPSVKHCQLWECLHVKPFRDWHSHFKKLFCAATLQARRNVICRSDAAQKWPYGNLGDLRGSLYPQGSSVCLCPTPALQQELDDQKAETCNFREFKPSSSVSAFFLLSVLPFGIYLLWGINVLRLALKSAWWGHREDAFPREQSSIWSSVLQAQELGKIPTQGPTQGFRFNWSKGPGRHLCFRVLPTPLWLLRRVEVKRQVYIGLETSKGLTYPGDLPLRVIRTMLSF